MGRILLIFIFTYALTTQALAGYEDSRTFVKISCMPELDYIEVTEVTIDTELTREPNDVLKRKYNLIDRKECNIAGNKYELQLVSQRGQGNAMYRCTLQPGVDLLIYENNILLKRIPKFLDECGYIASPTLNIDRYNLNYCNGSKGYGGLDCTTESLLSLRNQKH